MQLTPERAREMQSMRRVRRGGRPGRSQSAIRSALEAGMPTAEVIAALRDAVRDGSHWAITLWLAYAWGRPVPGGGDDADEAAVVDPATLSDAELAALVRARSAGSGRGAPRTAVPPSFQLPLALDATAPAEDAPAQETPAHAP
jgi:hypothetical protein